MGVLVIYLIGLCVVGSAYWISARLFGSPLQDAIDAAAREEMLAEMDLNLQLYEEMKTARERRLPRDG